MDYSAADFGEDFHWGVSTSAFQIEGGYNLDGKGLSIWDTFTSIKRKQFRNANAHVASDFYHRFKEDLELMAKMNIPNYRFSLSWTRIFPGGIGTVNTKGVDYYNQVIDSCLELGIQPWITLYHWDLPQALELKGGWTNRQMLDWFGYYCAYCIKVFGDRVKHWMILNEPLVFTGAGYFFGVHAPGRKGLNNFLSAVHHAALCQAEGGRILKSARGDLQVGTTFSCTLVEPVNSSKSNELAATRVDALLNRLFIEPMLGLGYPVTELRVLKKLEPFIKSGDEQRIQFSPDFVGVQNYTREVVAHRWLTPYLQAAIVKASKRKVEITEMDWEVYPPAIYAILKKIASYEKVKKIIVTENGAAFFDTVKQGEVHDFRRKKFLQQYIQQVLRAKNEGVPINGYFVWSFMDNFEWAEGYRPRFGLVHVDYTTQKRTVKSSGGWYSRFLLARKHTLI